MKVVKVVVITCGCSEFAVCTYIP